MSSRNHMLRFRPLRGGIALYNPNVGRMGTLGLIAYDADNRPWIVSARHVLCRADFDAAGPPDQIYQPFDDQGPPVAFFDGSRMSEELDAAAARVDVSSVTCVDEVLCIGGLATVADPFEGQIVIKAGGTTGVTEGRVAVVNGDAVEIEIPLDYPPILDLSEGGDSGAVWVDRHTLAPVALHTGGNTSGREVAFGVSLRTVLRDLGLTVRTVR